MINAIRIGDVDDALSYVAKRLLQDCKPLIRSKNKTLGRYEIIGVFYDAFLDLADRVKSGKFQFMGEAAFATYFKRSCVNQAFNLTRGLASGDIILPAEIIEILEEDAGKLRDDVAKSFIDDKFSLYGIRLELPESDEMADCLDEVVKVFHTLGEKCKFLIVFKFFLKFSHQEIIDSLRLFYDIKTPEVSRVELARCIGNIRKGLPPQKAA
jgi:hypothetical protein